MARVIELPEEERQRILTALDSILAHCEPGKIIASTRTRLQADLSYIHDMAVACQQRVLGLDR